MPKRSSDQCTSGMVIYTPSSNARGAITHIAHVDQIVMHCRLDCEVRKRESHVGYDRIQGELAKVGYPISDTTVSNILKAHGIEPAPTTHRIAGRCAVTWI